MTNKALLFLIGCIIGSCQLKNSPLPPQKQVIPFELTAHNNLSIEAIINGKDTVQLMLHTAANSVDLTAQAAKNTTTVGWNQEVDVNTWGGDASSRVSINNTLAISGLHWDSVTIFENQHSGPTTDGKFGLQLFTDKVIEINYDQQQLIIHPTLPNYVDEYVRIPIQQQQDMLFIEGSSIIEGKIYPNQFLIHSGYGGTILYDDAFVAKNKIGARIPIIEQQELKDAHGNTLVVKKGTLPLFKIGDHSFEDLPVGFFEGAIGRQKMSVLGGDILKRFNLIIDKERAFIYLKPSQLVELPFTKK